MISRSNGQVIFSPNYGLKSHETLGIDRIETRDDQTVFHFTIENRIAGGSFCADRNIYVVYPDLTKEKVIRAEGIPVCPDEHRFALPGEKLSFALVFPKLKNNPGWVSIIEDCSDNCFSFYGVVLDATINERLNILFDLVEKEDPERALTLLESFLEETDHLNLGTEGLIYTTLIDLCRQNGDRESAARWYRSLMKSGAPDAGKYIRHLNLNGVIY